VHIVELLKAFLLAIDAVRVETPLPDTIVRVAVNGGGQTQAVQHIEALGRPLRQKRVFFVNSNGGQARPLPFTLVLRNI
jgi:hypothetical protein